MYASKSLGVDGVVWVPGLPLVQLVRYATWLYTLSQTGATSAVSAMPFNVLGRPER